MLELNVDEAVTVNDIEFFKILKVCYRRTGTNVNLYWRFVAKAVDRVLRHAENPLEFRKGGTEQDDVDHKVMRLLGNLSMMSKIDDPENQHNHEDNQSGQSCCPGFCLPVCEDDDGDHNPFDDKFAKIACELGYWHLLACCPVFYLANSGLVLEPARFLRIDRSRKAFGPARLPHSAVTVGRRLQ